MKNKDDLFLWKMWEKKWQNDIKCDFAKKFFLKCYENIYLYANRKRIKNKKCTFGIKILFVFIIFAAILFFIIPVTVAFCKIGNLEMNAVKMFGIEAIGIALLCIPLHLWYSAKKYQETWVRHSMIKRYYDIEMLKYLSELKPYSKENGDKIFMENIVKLSRENIDRFSDNMNNKEIDLMKSIEGVFSLRK